MHALHDEVKPRLMPRGVLAHEHGGVCPKTRFQKCRTRDVAHVLPLVVHKHTLLFGEFFAIGPQRRNLRDPVAACRQRKVGFIATG